MKSCCIFCGSFFMGFCGAYFVQVGQKPSQIYAEIDPIDTLSGGFGSGERLTNGFVGFIIILLSVTDQEKRYAMRHGPNGNACLFLVCMTLESGTNLKILRIQNFIMNLA